MQRKREHKLGVKLISVFVMLGFWAVLGGAGCGDDRSVPGGNTECGDGVCQGEEDATSCPQDCEQTECGDGVCGGDENATNCPADCSVAACGDGVCNGAETPYDCPADCQAGTCGNHICEGGEQGVCDEDCGSDGCGNGICEADENPTDCPADCEQTRKVDVLFVVDNSGSMRNEQEQLAGAFPVFFEALRESAGSRPDLHVGVVSPDLGTNGYNTIRYCEEPGGDGGILGRSSGVDRGEACLGPAQRYLVDLEPEGCTINRNSLGNCIEHDCAQVHCDALAQGDEALTLVTDEHGCPRCRNFADTPASTFSCLAELGTNGCGFEQQLEALRKALDVSETPENDGFVREDALLVVVLVTDEDDCSAAQPDIIFNPDPSENRIDSSLGFLHSFRCFEFGVTCDVNDRQIMGPRNDCAPREDDQALLHPVSHYVEFLIGLKDPGRILVAALAGPVNDQVIVQKDAQNRPEVKPSCVDTSAEGAIPGVRLKAFTAHFNGPSDLDAWAYSSICKSEFNTALSALGEAIRVRLGQ